MRETYENDTEFDLAYVTLVYLTFLPSLILPWFYTRWILIGTKPNIITGSLTKPNIITGTLTKPNISTGTLTKPNIIKGNLTKPNKTNGPGSPR